jgi:hypothetical protein
MPTIDLKDSESQNSEVYNLKVTIGALKFVGRTILGAQRRRIKLTNEHLAYPPLAEVSRSDGGG